MMKTGLDERVERALRRAGLWDEVKDRLGGSLELSGGQRSDCTSPGRSGSDRDVLLIDGRRQLLMASTASVEELIRTSRTTTRS